MKCFAIHSNCSVLICVFKKMAWHCQERLFPSAWTCKSSLKNTANKIKSISFLFLCSSPSAETLYAKLLNNLHSLQSKHVQEISWLGFKGIEEVLDICAAHASLGTEMKLEKSYLHFPMAWAERSFCAGPLQGSRRMRREGMGSFKAWYNEEMPPTPKDGWESFCKHFIGGLATM